MRFLHYLFIIGLLTGTNAICAEDKKDSSLRVGAAAVDITPERLPVSMTGSFQDRMATGVQDRLHARALVISDGTHEIAIVVCDICLITRDIFDAAKAEASKATGIPENRMLMSSTHTHTAPTAVPLAQCNPDPEYVALLTRRITESVIKAHANLKPGKIGWATGNEPDEVGNRRWHVMPGNINKNPFGRSNDKVRTNAPRGSDILIKPAGPVDPEVAIVSLVDAKGKPVSLLANYGLHYVGGIPPFKLSADYFGEFARQIADRLDGDSSFVGILSNGASGDVNNYKFQNPRASAQAMKRIEQVAGKIADVTIEALKPIEHRSDLSLAMIERSLDLKIRKPDEADLNYARTLLAAAENPQKLSTFEVYASETVRIDKLPDGVTIKLQALRIGDELGIVAIPCEVFAEIGLEIKKRSPFKTTFVIALANGYNGYLPSPKQHALGGYETWRSGWSYLEVDASTKITDKVVEMLGKL